MNFQVISQCTYSCSLKKISEKSLNVTNKNCSPVFKMHKLFYLNFTAYFVHKTIRTYSALTYLREV